MVITIGNLYFWVLTNKGSLQNHIIANTPFDTVNKLLERLIKGDEKLTSIIAEALIFARKYNYISLEKFCLTEIKGIQKSNLPLAVEVKYRVQQIYCSYKEMKLNPFSALKPTEGLLIEEMKQAGGFDKYSFCLPYSINDVESVHNQITSTGQDHWSVIESNTSIMFPDYKGKERKMFVYIFSSNYVSLYRNIRQKAIDLLLDAKI